MFKRSNYIQSLSLPITQTPKMNRNINIRPRQSRKTTSNKTLLLTIFVLFVILMTISIVLLITKNAASHENISTIIDEQTQDGSVRSTSTVKNDKKYKPSDSTQLIGSLPSDSTQNYSCTNNGFLSSATLKFDPDINRLCDIGVGCSDGDSMNLPSSSCTSQSGLTSSQGFSSIDVYTNNGNIVGMKIGTRTYGSTQNAIETTINCPSTNSIFVGMKKNKTNDRINGLQFICGNPIT